MSTILHSQETYYGTLQVNVTSIVNARPIANATVQIYPTGDNATLIAEETTNMIGKTRVITLPAPNAIFSQEPSVEQPYAEYTLLISA